MKKVVNGVLMNMTPEEIAARPAGPTEEEIRWRLVARVIVERDQRIKTIAAGYTPTERETWPVQVEEAKAVTADPAAPTPMLTRLAAARGLTVLEMAERVLALNAAFSAVTGQVMGAATKLLAMDPIPEDFTDGKWWAF